MGAPIYQPNFTSKQVFTDGSVAARHCDSSPWTVICGPDLNHNEPTAPCDAANFADRQNSCTSLVFKAANDSRSQAAE